MARLTANPERTAEVGRVREVVDGCHQARDWRFGVRVAHQRKRTVRHPVVPALEGEDATIPRHRLHKFERRLDGVSSRRATELNFRPTGELVGQTLEQRIDESLFGRRRDVEGVKRAVRGEDALDGFPDPRVIVAECERSSPGEAVVVLVPVHVGHGDALRLADGEW